MAPKVDLGASWAPFGEGLGRSWGSFGSSWALPGRFFGVWKRPLIKHWSTMGSKRPSSSILEPPGLNFGAPGPRFWSLRVSIFKLPGVVLPSLGCSCFLLLSLAGFFAIFVDFSWILGGFRVVFGRCFRVFLQFFLKKPIF